MLNVNEAILSIGQSKYLFKSVTLHIFITLYLFFNQCSYCSLREMFKAGATSHLHEQ